MYVLFYGKGEMFIILVLKKFFELSGIILNLILHTLEQIHTLRKR